LPIILRTNNAGKAKYLLKSINVPRLVHQDQYYLGKVTIRMATVEEMKGVPDEY
jgi:hypothetical protein